MHDARPRRSTRPGFILSYDCHVRCARIVNHARGELWRDAAPGKSVGHERQLVSESTAQGRAVALHNLFGVRLDLRCEFGTENADRLAATF